MGETITVRWAGREVTVELTTPRALRISGAIAGGPRLVCYGVSRAPVCPGSSAWYAEVILPEDVPFFDEAGDRTLYGVGNTPQESLDALAEQLRRIAAWANELLA